jgi:hypothetical protein
MFKGSEKGDSCRRAEEKTYSPDVNMIFNPKAYANTQNLKGWEKNQFEWGTPLPRLLVLDSFEPHENSRKQEEANDLVDEFKSLTRQSLLFLVAVLATFNLLMSLLIRSLRISSSNVRRTTMQAGFRYSIDRANDIWPSIICPYDTGITGGNSLRA